MKCFYGLGIIYSYKALQNDCEPVVALQCLPNFLPSPYLTLAAGCFNRPRKTQVGLQLGFPAMLGKMAAWFSGAAVPKPKKAKGCCLQYVGRHLEDDLVDVFTSVDPSESGPDHMLSSVATASSAYPGIH
jgi:hypothetical protein